MPQFLQGWQHGAQSCYCMNVRYILETLLNLALGNYWTAQSLFLDSHVIKTQSTAEFSLFTCRNIYTSNIISSDVPLVSVQHDLIFGLEAQKIVITIYTVIANSPNRVFSK